MNKNRCTPPASGQDRVPRLEVGGDCVFSHGMRRDQSTGEATAQEHPESTLARFRKDGKTASAAAQCALSHAPAHLHDGLDEQPTVLDSCLLWIQSDQGIFGADKPVVVHRFSETEREADPRLADGGKPIGDKLF